MRDLLGVLGRLAFAVCIAAGAVLAASFGTSMALCSSEQLVWMLLLAIGFLLAWPMALACAGGVALLAVKLPAGIARFGWARIGVAVGVAWVACAGAGWLLAGAFGRRGCSMLI